MQTTPHRIATAALVRKSRSRCTTLDDGVTLLQEEAAVVADCWLLEVRTNVNEFNSNAGSVWTATNLTTKSTAATEKSGAFSWSTYCFFLNWILKVKLSAKQSHSPLSRLQMQRSWLLDIEYRWRPKRVRRRRRRRRRGERERENLFSFLSNRYTNTNNMMAPILSFFFFQVFSTGPCRILDLDY